MADSSELRIVIFGKAKSNNKTVTDLLEENLEQGKINGRKVKMIEAPGIFDPDNKAEDLQKALISCIVDCSPGVHAFILVMKVDKYTDEEKALVSMISMCFGEGILKYTAVLYTHGQRLDEGQSIEDFAKTNDDLKKFVEDCGGGVHVIDSKSWNENGMNSKKLKNLIKSIGVIVSCNDRGYRTTESLDVIKKKVENIIKEMSPGKTDREAKAIVEMIKILTAVLIEVPTLLLLSIMVGIRKGLEKDNVEQVILKAIQWAVKGAVDCVTIAIDSSDVDEVLNKLQGKIKAAAKECIQQ